ncbi:MAG TPA: S8 family serine peptidase [Chitinispirillaceae bacterium]|nr:S8 family serine peptidase [Chitinispirillaceae bacterium]
MKTKLIVLRSKAHQATKDPFSGSFSFSRGLDVAPSVFKVDTEEIDSRDIPLISRDSSVLALAPVMPIKMIAPLRLELDTVPKLGIEAWGVRAVGADKSPYTGNGIVVSVLDTGIDMNHAAFSDVQIIQKDFTGEGNGDQNGHGTHCAGTIFGRDVQGMRIGVAIGVKKTIIGKVLDKDGAGSTDQIMDAIVWAIDSGANVISMSLGMDFPGFVKYLVEKDYPLELATSIALDAYRANTQLFERLAALIRANGNFSQTTIIVAAAGNESRRNINPDWEISVSPPAVSEGIISVAALDEAENGQLSIASFSNTGANVSAPGVSIISAKSGGGLIALSGTSMAAPHVAGIAAIWAEKLKKNGRLNSVELSARVIGTARMTNFTPGYDPFDVGAGMVWAPQE